MKNFKKLTSLLCSAALLMSLLTVFSFSPAAASAASIKLRIEGQSSTIYSGNVSFKAGDNLYDILEQTLNANNIPLTAPLSSYGHMIDAINNEVGNYPTWWHIYVNGAAVSVGADSILPANGDEAVFYLADDSITLYPEIKFSPEIPVAGQQETINVSASYTDYSDPSYPVITENISGVTITFNGKKYITDSNGNVKITMPAAGSYIMTASKEKKDSTHAIVRSGDITVTVSSSSSSGNNNNKNNKNNDSSQTSTYSSAAVSSKTISDAISSGANYIQNSDICDWSAALALSRAGKSVPNSFLRDTKDELYASGNILPAHLAGLIIGIKSAGADPCSFCGRNLIKELYSASNIGKSGLNGYAYGLLAFDCGNYAIPSGAAVSRSSLINSILSYQKSNGAFSLDKTSAADSDMTAIAITALAPYTDRANVKNAVNKAVAYLSGVQKSDGGFVPSYSKEEVCESTAQAIIALSSVNIDPQSDSRFIKNGNTPVSALLSFKNSDGGFSHIKGAGSDVMATEQAVTALLSLKRRQNSDKSLYNLTDVKVTVENPDTGASDSQAPIAVISAAAILALALLYKKSANILKKQ